MARMTIDELIRRNIIGPEALSQLYGKLGVQQWQTAPGGAMESGAPVLEDIPNADAMRALQGYTFDWNDTGTGNTGTLTAYDPSGNQYGQFQQQDQSTLQQLGEAAALAAAGFGGVGLMGLGPLGGLLGGAGAAGGGLSAGAVDAAALGLDAGLSSAAGGGIVGGGLTAPTLGAGAGVGAGLGTIGAGAAGAGTAAAGAAGAGGLLSSLGGAKSLIPVAGSLLGTGLQMSAAGQARDDMQAATRSANDLQKYMYDTTRADNMPALQARNSALQQMQALLSDPSTLTSQPGYQFGMDQGTRALNNGAAARGMTYSGAAGKALTRFGQDYAGTKLNESANRLMALASGGQSGASQIGGAGMNYAGQVGNALMQQGDANAAYRVAGGNALADTINGLTAYGVRQKWWGG